MRGHELVLIFYKKLPTYNKQMRWEGVKNKKTSKGGAIVTKNFTTNPLVISPYTDTGWRNPTTVIDFPSEGGGKLHPTQKPVALFEYLIKTYTNEGETVMDNCSGSGTTAISCIRTNRNYICMEKELKYYELSKERVKKELAQTKLKLAV